MEEKSQGWLPLLIYSGILLLYVVVGVIAAHPFDDALYAQHAQFFYYLSINPSFGLSMGIYYDFINIAGYFFTILMSFAGVSDILTIQAGIKIPFILFTFLTAYVLYKIMSQLGYDGRYAALILLTSPIYFFTSVIYGSAIVISMFFLISSVYFLFGNRTLISAILFGISAGTYLYPIFSIPFLLRYVHKEHGKRETLVYLLVAVAFAVIGQLTVLYFYSASGYYAISPNAPSGYFSSTAVPFYSIFDLLNIFKASSAIPGQVYYIVYYASAIIASLSYFLVSKEKVDKESLLVFLLIQGVLFAAINPFNLPSYMSAVIPLAIILAITQRRWVLIGILWIATGLSFLVMQTVSGVGFLIYFSDLNHNLLKINATYPWWLNSLAGFVYSFTLLIFIPLMLRKRKDECIRPVKTFISQFSTVAVLFVIAIIVLVPVASSVPSGMFLSQEINQFQAQPVSESLSGSSLLVEYSIPVVGFVEPQYYNFFIGYFEMPSNVTITETPINVTVPPGQFVENISIPYPIGNATLEVFGTENGSVSAELANKSSILSPNSFHASASNSTYKFTFYTILSGSYALKLSSDIPLLAENSGIPSIILKGSPEFGKISLGKYLLTGNYIPGNLLNSEIIIKYAGPFISVPPFVPSINIYLIKNFVTPTKSSLITGGAAFLVLLTLPILLIGRSKRGRRQSNNT